MLSSSYFERINDDDDDDLFILLRDSEILCDIMCVAVTAWTISSVRLLF